MAAANLVLNLTTPQERKERKALLYSPKQLPSSAEANDRPGSLTRRDGKKRVDEHDKVRASQDLFVHDIDPSRYQQTQT